MDPIILAFAIQLAVMLAFLVLTVDRDELRKKFASDSSAQLSPAIDSQSSNTSESSQELQADHEKASDASQVSQEVANRQSRIALQILLRAKSLGSRLRSSSSFKSIVASSRSPVKTTAATIKNSEDIKNEEEVSSSSVPQDCRLRVHRMRKEKKNCSTLEVWEERERLSSEGHRRAKQSIAEEKIQILRGLRLRYKNEMYRSPPRPNVCFGFFKHQTQDKENLLRNGILEEKICRLNFLIYKRKKTLPLKPIIEELESF